MTDETEDAEELLKQSAEQSRHTSEPTSSREEDAPDRVDAIKEALDDIEDGDAPENINLRDARLKALLVGLGDAGELEDAASALAPKVDVDVDTSDISQSDIARLLLRLGLQEALPEVYDAGREAAKKRAVEQAEQF